ncbi:MAG: ribosomal protein S18-alanine N-acetyltransferase [Christensenellales bacterium]
MAEPRLRRMREDDLDAVHAIEAACFALPWTRDMFLSELTHNKVARYLVLEDAGQIIGFAGAHMILDQGHVTNIAISAPHRGKGRGRLLTLGLMQYAANLGVQYMTLEVRQSNQAAISLYSSLHFVKVSVRKRYYEDNGEDAWLMVCDRLPPPHEDFEEPETLFT